MLNQLSLSKFLCHTYNLYFHSQLTERTQAQRDKWFVQDTSINQLTLYIYFPSHTLKSSKILYPSVGLVAQLCEQCRGLQHTRPPYPSPTPRVHSNTCPLRQWCYPTISSSVVPFSSCPQSLPASGSFLMSQLFASGGQSIGVSASASVLPINTQDWSPLGWTGWISLQSKGLSRVFSNTTVQKNQFSVLNFLYSSTLTSIHYYWKSYSLD